MSVKAFISQPMGGRTSEQIQSERLDLIKQLRALYGSDVEILNSYFPRSGASPVAMLGRCIEVLSEATVAIFATGWEKSRGCRIEHMVCKEYGIKILD